MAKKFLCIICNKDYGENMSLGADKLYEKTIEHDFINNIIQGDAIEIMKQIPDNFVDMSFADPPFNLGKRYNVYYYRKKESEYIEWSKKWIKEMVRITKPTGSIFIYNMPKWLLRFSSYLDTIAYFNSWIVWDEISRPFGKTLVPSHYGILWYTKKPTGFKFYRIRRPHQRCRVCGSVLQDYGGKKSLMHPFGPLVSDVWRDIHRVRHKNHEHCCQLPIPLLERLILMTTDEEDIVLDPFVGTGTTAIAAKRLGRRYIGIDIDNKYINIAEERLKSVIQTKIDNCYVSIYNKEIITIRDKDWKTLFSNHSFVFSVKNISHNKHYSYSNTKK